MQKRDFCVRTEKISARTWNISLHCKISEKNAIYLFTLREMNAKTWILCSNWENKCQKVKYRYTLRKLCRNANYFSPLREMNAKTWFFGFELRKQVQESHILVYIVQLVQKRKLCVYINRNECKNVIFRFKLRK